LREESAMRTRDAVWLALLVLSVVLTAAVKYLPYLPGDVSSTLLVQSMLPAPKRWAQLLSSTTEMPWVLLLITVTFLLSWVMAGWRAALLSLVCFAGLWLLGKWLGPFVAQPRPSADLVRVTGSPSGSAFPSIFAFNYIATVGFLAVLAVVKTSGKIRWAVLLVGATLLLAGWIARVDLAAHWPSDVGISCLIGLLWVTLLIRFLEGRELRRFSLRNYQQKKEVFMDARILTSRRRFLATTWGLAAGLALPVFPNAALAAERQEGKGNESEVTPVEDLMREHGILRRVLLIYEELVRRLEGTKELPTAVIGDTAGIIRRFVEDYHEKLLEQDELFQRFEKAGKLVDLVKVLYAQHQAGRHLTDLILASAKPPTLTGIEARQKLSLPIRQFIRMYRPHAAREDTVLFPALRSIVSPREYDELGEMFEEKEEKLFGKGGFGNIVEQVTALEKALGIYDLAQFTPTS